MTRRAPARPKSRADGESALRRKPVEAADAEAAQEIAAAPVEIEELGPLHRPEEVPAQATPMRGRDPRKAAALAVVGLLCAVGAAAGVGKALSERGRGGLGPVPAHADTPSTPPVAAPEAKPILADYRPPDRDQVRKAYLNVASVYRTEGLSGVVRQGIDCFDTLKQTPGYEMLDYCIALDAFGESLAKEMEAGHAAAAGGYFTGAEPRELAAAKAVVGADGDAGARVVDVRRLAGEVSHDGPAAARAAVAALSAAPSATQAAVEAAPSSGPAAKLRGPQVALATPQPLPTAAKPAPPKPAKAAVERAAPVRVAAAKPVHKAEKRRAEPRPAFEHARLQHASAKVEHKPKPVIKAVSKAPSRPAPRHPLRVAARTPSHHEPPRLFRAVGHAAENFAHAVKTALHPQPKPTQTVAERRSSEPAEWIDCRRPRTLTESRICEDIDSRGDGTLQGQLSRSKYEESSGRQ